MAARVLGFDVYGTLVDTQGVGASLDHLLPGRGSDFATAWRQKQLEYTFRRAVMRTYRDFDECTRAALDHTESAFRAHLPSAEKQALLEQYRRLPVFPDVRPALEQLSRLGARLIAFSNGVPSAIHELLQHAGIRERFEDIVSVDEIKSYKPDPAVYVHFANRACASCGECWLVSANPFDVVGAINAGIQAAWVQRDPHLAFDPWELQPTAVIPDLFGLADLVTSRQAA